jgi:hypothetical protein
MDRFETRLSAKMGPSRLSQLQQLLDDAVTCGDLDRRTEVLSDLFHEFSTSFSSGEPSGSAEQTQKIAGNDLARSIAGFSNHEIRSSYYTRNRG